MTRVNNGALRGALVVRCCVWHGATLVRCGVRRGAECSCDPMYPQNNKISNFISNEWTTGRRDSAGLLFLGRKSPGSVAMLAAFRRAASFVSLADDSRRASPRKRRRRACACRCPSQRMRAKIFNRPRWREAASRRCYLTARSAY
jgi:hypothetical protein